MRGLMVRKGTVVLEHDVPQPVPGRGQVLARPLLCGICGSDLHAPILQVADPANWPEAFVLGHEYWSRSSTTGLAATSASLSVPGSARCRTSMARFSRSWSASPASTQAHCRT
jgi:D-arabinose 1-dehydrogenase-like Zn-dependent alcohol dehydrogenase